MPATSRARTPGGRHDRSRRCMERAHAPAQAAARPQRRARRRSSHRSCSILVVTMWFRRPRASFMRAPGSFSTTRAPRLAGSAVSRRLMHSPRSYFHASTPRPRPAQQDRPGACSLRQRARALAAAEPAGGHTPSCGGMPHHPAHTPDPPLVTVEKYNYARLPLWQAEVPAEVPTQHSRGGGPGRCRSSRRS